ncbi:Bromo-adjacent-like (BAH) domain protein [Quillaja saponaria]|uniref:Bromo-adjacent-like (BAH) domain protein n=1 Tax=Quillaja saponaria TaxID=32244 RepID=A0AAD7KU12_QUISA|nr:Bromo-adjacent-like (BAH) domain protein [Quillaja saponaria]
MKLISLLRKLCRIWLIFLILRLKIPAAELKAETPGSCITNASEYYTILVKFNALTGENQRDKWLERLLQGIQYVCNSGDNIQRDEKGKRKTESQEKSQKGSKCFIWPDASIPAIVALEKASHDALGTDFQKYNQKLRQLLFNLKNNALLAQRLLDGELEPSKILNMSPSELKEGLTSEEIAKKEPAESEGMQMTDARCSRCMEFKVGLRDIIHGGHEDRYQLECIACGNSWYASRDETSKLTINAPNLAKSVGTAPWATAKFEEVEKKMMNPREPDKAVDDLFRKTSEAFMPVLDSQKSFGKPIKDEHSEATRNAD